MTRKKTERRHTKSSTHRFCETQRCHMSEKPKKERRRRLTCLNWKNWIKLTVGGIDWKWVYNNQQSINLCIFWHVECVLQFITVVIVHHRFWTKSPNGMQFTFINNKKMFLIAEPRFVDIWVWKASDSSEYRCVHTHSLSAVSVRSFFCQYRPI